MGQSPVDPESIEQASGDDDGTTTDESTAVHPPIEVSFRSVSAINVTVIPSKATRKHLRGVVKENGNGKTKILKGDGTEGELDGKGGEFGDDFVLIVKSEHGGGNSSVTNTVSEDEIIDRIDALTLAAEDNPELAEGLDKLRGKVNEKRLERLEALIENSDPEDQDLIDSAVTKARGKSESSGNSGSSGGSSSSDSGGDNSGGGNSGNQGGGKNK